MSFRLKNKVKGTQNNNFGIKNYCRKNRDFLHVPGKQEEEIDLKSSKKVIMKQVSWGQSEISMRGSQEWQIRH